LSTAIIASFCVSPAPAQTQEQKPQLYLIGDFLVNASKATEYEAAVKELITNLGKYEFPFSFDTYSTDDLHYYMLYLIQSYADVDLWVRAWGDMWSKIGTEKLQALHNRVVDAEIERVYQFWFMRPDLSYFPENPRLKPEETGFYHWQFVSIIPGKEKEFEEINRQWIALNKRLHNPDPFYTWAGDLGTAMPVYCWIEQGKSAADYFAADENFWKTAGEEGAALSKKTRSLIKKIETKTGRYRPDLSYTPKEK
jgi:hypothetical protein